VISVHSTVASGELADDRRLNRRRISFDVSKRPGCGVHEESPTLRSARRELGTKRHTENVQDHLSDFAVELRKVFRVTCDAIRCRQNFVQYSVSEAKSILVVPVSRFTQVFFG